MYNEAAGANGEAIRRVPPPAPQHLYCMHNLPIRLTYFSSMLCANGIQLFTPRSAPLPLMHSFCLAPPPSLLQLFTKSILHQRTHHHNGPPSPHRRTKYIGVFM